MKLKVTYLVIGILIGVIIVGFFSINYLSPKSVQNMPMSQNSPRGNDIDSHFIEQMIPHHEDAITMSKLALTKAEHDELKSLAESIIESQGKEIEQMKSWYQEWYGYEISTGSEVMQHHGMGSGAGMHMGLAGDESDISRLSEADSFDIAFIEHMIPHHQMAVMMASMLKNGTKRDEMRKLADDIIIAQTSEIELMRKWLSEWQ